MNYQLHHERLAIPKAAADEVPPGLTNLGLQKHFGISYYQAKLWVFHTGYRLSDKWSRQYPKEPRKPMARGRPAYQLPSATLADMPEGLCHYEVADKLGVPVQVAKRWANAVGYKLTDGRRLYGGPRNPERESKYIPVLTAGANTKTLEEVGQELGITRERVRQLYEKHGIRREKNPHSSWKDSELVNKVRELAPVSKNVLSIANAVGVERTQVDRILKIHKIPFKNWIRKRLEQEIATGIRTCTKCRTPKPLTDYYKQHDGRLGKLEMCRDCVNLMARNIRERKGTPVRGDKKEYWEKLRRERHIKEPAPLDQPIRAKPLPIHPAFGLTAEQINKLKEGKM